VAFGRHDNSFPLVSDDSIVTKITRVVDVARVQHREQRGKARANAQVIALPSASGKIGSLTGDTRTAKMLSLTKEQEAALGLELAAKRQEHADLDAAIHTLSTSGYSDQMLIQRMKKRKLALKDRITQLENILLPDIIA
jgi:hypothetical protein